jgi:hypothetical protein
MTECLLCHKENHTAYHCNSLRAQTVDEAVNHWIYHKLQQIYSVELYEDRKIKKLAEAHHMTRLSIGDLLFLMRNVIDPKNMEEFSKMYTKSQYICLFLGYKTRELLQTHYNSFSENVIKRLSIDARYWTMCAKSGVEEAERLRAIDLYEELPNADVPNEFECAVCYGETFTRGEMATFQCSHWFCRGCIRQMIDRGLVCPLCREPVEQVIYTSNDGRNIYCHSI